MIYLLDAWPRPFVIYRLESKFTYNTHRRVYRGRTRPPPPLFQLNIRPSILVTDARKTLIWQSDFHFFLGEGLQLQASCLRRSHGGTPPFPKFLDPLLTSVNLHCLSFPIFVDVGPQLFPKKFTSTNVGRSIGLGIALSSGGLP